MTAADRHPVEVTVQYEPDEPRKSWVAPWAHIADGCLKWGDTHDPSKVSGIPLFDIHEWSIRAAPRPSVVTMDLLGPYPSEEDV